MVEAAGGLVVRNVDGDRRVLVVHRPHYDDWSFPKGKLDPGEDHLGAALREVLEETGLACTADRELPEVRYTDHRGRPKRVRYWLMTPIGAAGGPAYDTTGIDGGDDPEGPFVPNDEVDRIRWCTAAEAAELLTYPHDATLLDRI